MSETVFEGRYQLTERIGMGGMAIVYKAVDLKTGHNVAVKVLRPEYNEDAEFISRFQREADAAQKMTHHNIVNLLDVGVEDGNRYLVMEYVQGKTLKEVIQERGRLSAPLACQITIRILSALEHAHRAGIVHRDIKPQNILVHADGHIKVADFGIARIADAATLTRGDMVMGSVHYFSPEQARGEGASAASDLYSTGVVLYEMLTGRVPFDGENPVAVAMQHLHAQPIPIQHFAPDVPPAVSQVCLKAMEKNPALRYQSAREMAADLRAALEERQDRPPQMELEQEIVQPRPHLRDDKLAEPTKKHRKTQEQERRVRIRWIALSVAAALAVAVGLFYGVRGLISRYATTGYVPAVEGLTRQEAEKQLKDAGMKYIIRESSSNEYDRDVVINQTPKANQIIQKQRESVQLMVSTGAQKQKMPSNVVGFQLSDAVSLLKNMGMVNVVSEKVVSDRAMEEVISTSPQAGEPVEPDTLITLSVSGGQTIVPDLTGLTLAETERKALDSHLTLGTQLKYQDTSDPALHGTVCAQDPEAETRAILEKSVDLTLYRCWEVYREEEVSFVVEESDTNVEVRVTIQAEGSQTVWPVKNMTVGRDEIREQTVLVPLPDNRAYTCIVYQNNEMGPPIQIEGANGG